MALREPAARQHHRHALLRAWVTAGLVLVTAFAGALMASQRRSREDVRARFAEHASLSAGLTESVFRTTSASSSKEYGRAFGTRRVPQHVMDAFAARTHSISAVLLDARGRRVAASRQTPPAVLAALAKRPRFVRDTIAGRPYALSDITPTGRRGGEVIQYAAAFSSASGRRILVSGFRPQVIYSFFGDYLSKIPNDGGQAYVLDANGVVVGGARGHAVRPGLRVTERGLLAAMTTGRRSGKYGNRYFAASPVRGSGWHVVLTAPQAVLFASVSGLQMWLPWIIVLAFALAAGLATQLLLRSRRAASELRRSQQRYELVVRGSNDGIWDRDLQTGELYVSPRWREILGLGDDVVVTDASWEARIHSADLERLHGQVAATISGAQPTLDLDYRIRHADGSWRWVLVRGAVTYDEEGRPARLAGSMSDITDSKLAEDRLRDGALRDALTGLANRALFLDRLEVALERTQRDAERRCAVLFLDIDRFKLINDSYSHAVGDELLVELGRRLTALLRPGDTVGRAATEDEAPRGTVARLGGDEFTILLDDVRSPEQPQQVAERILRSLERPFVLGERTVSVGASVGIAFSESGSTASEMMRNADLAMYQAKRQGSTTSALYNDEMHARVSERLDLEIALRDVLEQGTLRVFYQPIVDLRTGRAAGFEALARWPEGPVAVEPAEFIPVAEETGLIAPLWRLVLGAACHQLAAWRADGTVGDDVTMSVNVARCQLDDPERLIAEVREALDASQLPAGALRLEITESTVISDPARLQATLAELRALGVRADIDDFGTGYSSLTFLQHFPGDTLKIDRSFVSAMVHHEGHREIVRAIIALAHDLGLRTIAEGIDSASQLRLLQGLGCEFGQGFLYAQPAPAADVPTVLADLRREEADRGSSAPVGAGRR